MCAMRAVRSPVSAGVGVAAVGGGAAATVVVPSRSVTPAARGVGAGSVMGG